MKVKVRAAVAIDQSGLFNIVGHSAWKRQDKCDESSLQAACDGVENPLAIAWRGFIEAEIDVPDKPPTIAAQVTEALASERNPQGD